MIDFTLQMLLVTLLSLKYCLLFYLCRLEKKWKASILNEKSLILRENCIS